MNEDIILVDDQDNEIGYAEKMYTHINGILHRAFSIFIYDQTSKKMLLQKRAAGKYHSGGLWTNACCSHPRKGENMIDCLNSRLRTELGLELNLIMGVFEEGTAIEHDYDWEIFECGTFKYFAPYDSLSEHEIDHVYLYAPKDGCSWLKTENFNLEEISDLKWITIDELNEWISNSPTEFTAWFPKAYEIICSALIKL